MAKDKIEQKDEKKPQNESVFPAFEREVLSFWKERDIFKKSLKKESPKGEYVFYDGPPFATGLPHYGHILPSTIKDVIPRFKTMQGYHVPRRWGWDCHGLPVENLVEKELGLKSKKDIEDYGIEKFNDKACESVMRFADDWREIIPRVGRFVDMENDYKTMDSSYTESIWWAFKQLHQKKLLYQGFKSMHVCPHCETTLSNFEVTQGYQDIKDSSVIVEFNLTDQENTSLLAWTTTPWTLPGNVALAVNPTVDYVEIEKKDGGDGSLVRFILAKERLTAVFKDDEYVVTKEIKGSSLVGKSYKPVFDYYANDAKLKSKENGWKVYAADFVTTEDGTGIVHIAPAFGEADLSLGQKENLPFVQHVGMDGRFTDEVVDFKGEPVKPKGRHRETDKKVIEYLKVKTVLFKEEEIIHSYPHCWRCDTPLLNYAASSWFVKVTDLKDKLVAENKKITWVPSEVGEGRFGKWLLGARDWAISRTRFWGAPIPVWQCDVCKKQEILGSISELSKKLPKRNRFLVMRHGEADNNVLEIVSSTVGFEHHLTPRGKEQVTKALTKLAREKVDLIVSSPLTRTVETAEIIREGLKLPKENLHLDKQLREVGGGDFDGKALRAYRDYFVGQTDRFNTKVSGVGGESYADVRQRMMAALAEIDKKHEGKTILIVSHESPLWLLETSVLGFDERKALEVKNNGKEDFIDNAEVREIIYSHLPYGENGEINLHRPHIDQVVFSCSCEGTMRRVPDVFDCWFESGSMPFAQNSFGGELLLNFNPEKSKGYPADFIAEGLDQTRGWFYSLIVLGVALFDKSPYKKVIVNGLILAENGQKMSKKLKNYPDPMEVVDRYGADALRLYLLSSPVVHGEDLRFSERGVKDIAGKTLGRLHNCLTFLQLNAPNEKAGGTRPESEHILDRWVVARLTETLELITASTEKGELDRATRPLHDFVDDLSVWYVRRSRDRFKSDNVSDRALVAATLAYVLSEFSKILAPFAPLYADYLYQKVGGVKESVHLEEWPNYKKLTDGESGLLLEMKDARSIVSLALEARAKANIKVRQPLSKLTVKRVPDNISDAMRVIIAEEVNVSEVVLNDEQSEEIVLDTVITPELKAEGDLRELIRAIQDLRKKAGLKQGELAVLSVSSDKNARTYLEVFAKKLLKVASINTINWEGEGGEKFEVNGHTFGFTLSKK